MQAAVRRARHGALGIVPECQRGCRPGRQGLTMARLVPRWLARTLMLAVLSLSCFAAPVGCRGLAREGRVVYIQAMPRLRQVSRDQADPFVRQIYQMLFGERDPVREPGTETGSPGNWWTVFALSPDCFRHAVLGFQLYRSADRKLDPKLRELGQLRAGWARGSRFVFSQHCKAARAVGLDEARVAAVPHWQTADVFTAVERAVLAYTDCLVLDGGRTPDGVFTALQSHLSDEEILELTYVTTLYEMHATMCRALRLEYDDVDERITEVAAPTETAMDVMRMVDS